jgi:hypothetical protein
MGCIVQQLGVLQDRFDLCHERLENIVPTRDKEISSNTYFLENDQPFRPRGDDLEEPMRKVAYNPNNNSRELHQCNRRHCYVHSFNKVTMKIRE